MLDSICIRPDLVPWSNLAKAPGSPLQQTNFLFSEPARLPKNEMGKIHINLHIVSMTYGSYGIALSN